MSYQNKVIIISGASGSGKTTLVNYLLQYKELNLTFSVSATTRQKRKYEINGEHYNFLSIIDFKNKIQSNDFLEWEEVYRNHFYGTLRSSAMNILNTGKNILFDVDVKGAQSIKNYFKDDSLSVFIQAPSIDIAVERLKKRKTESANTMELRVKKIKQEIKLGETMDVQLINDNLDVIKPQIYNLINQFLES